MGNLFLLKETKKRMYKILCLIALIAVCNAAVPKGYVSYQNCTSAAVGRTWIPSGNGWSPAYDDNGKPVAEQDANGVKILDGFCGCKQGFHTRGGLADNADNCISNVAKENGCNKASSNGWDCDQCSFWYWTQETHSEGNYCENKWWLWVAFFGAPVMFLVFVVSAVMPKKKSRKYDDLHGSELYLSGYEKTHGGNLY